MIIVHCKLCKTRLLTDIYAVGGRFSILFFHFGFVNGKCVKKASNSIYYIFSKKCNIILNNNIGRFSNGIIC